MTSQFRDREIITLPSVSGFAKLNRSLWREAAEVPLVMEEAENLPFFRYAHLQHQPQVREAIRHTASLTPSLLKLIEREFEGEVLHLSIGGSAIFRPHPADLDFNLILSGSHFSYREFLFSNEEALFGRNLPINRFSFITFGADDLLGLTEIDDSIHNQGYQHEDIMSRELLVYPLRNILLYGHPVEVSATTGQILSRVVTGIGFARRGLIGEVPRYPTPERKMTKAVSRLEEAETILRILIDREKSD